MNFYEALCFAKLFERAIGGQVSMSEIEKEVACESLKRMADQRNDWTEEQKNYYKMMVDFSKNIGK